MKPLVSILIPAYNAEKWIKETIDSAVAQIWPNKEIIIVDDGSTDNTYKVAKSYESSILKVVRQENKGASAARNKALQYAQGDYIQWLDADDILDENKIVEQIKQSKEYGNEKTLLSGPYGIFYYKTKRARFLASILWKDLSPIEWLVINFSKNLWMSSGVWLVNRKLTELAGPWNEKLSLNDDGEYFCRIICACDKIKFVETAKSYYRHWSFSTQSWSSSEKACMSMFQSQKLCINYLLLLENSERVKKAGLTYLQSTYDYFYPDKIDLIRQINELASLLGGNLSIPNQTWKYKLIHNMFGQNIATKLLKAKRDLQLFINKLIDRIIP